MVKNVPREKWVFCVFSFARVLKGNITIVLFMDQTQNMSKEINILLPAQRKKGIKVCGSPTLWDVGIY